MHQVPFSTQDDSLYVHSLQSSNILLMYAGNRATIVCLQKEGFLNKLRSSKRWENSTYTEKNIWYRVEYLVAKICYPHLTE